MSAYRFEPSDRAAGRGCMVAWSYSGLWLFLCLVPVASVFGVACFFEVRWGYLTYSILCLAQLLSLASPLVASAICRRLRVSVRGDGGGAERWLVARRRAFSWSLIPIFVGACEAYVRVAARHGVVAPCAQVLDWLVDYRAAAYFGPADECVYQLFPGILIYSLPYVAWLFYCITGALDTAVLERVTRSRGRGFQLTEFGRRGRDVAIATGPSRRTVIVSTSSSTARPRWRRYWILTSEADLLVEPDARAGVERPEGGA